MRETFKTLLPFLGAYFVALFSIILLELVFYLPRTNEFMNLLRSAPVYAGIYFWLSQRPDAFNLLSAFIIGGITDVLTGTPLGINIITFLVLYLISARLFFLFNIQKFSYSWLLFALATLLTLLFKGIALSIFYRHFIPLNPLLFEFFLTVILYPLLARVYMFIELRFIHLEDRYEKI